MEFKQFRDVFQRHVAEMFDGQNALFVSVADKDVMWELYLDSFPLGTNEVFRERRSHDCSCCRSFIKQFGGVVAIRDNEVVTAWGFDTGSGTYQPVVDALDQFIKSHQVKDVFVTSEGAFGTAENREQLEDGSVHTWSHFRVDMPARLVSRSHKTQASLMAEARTNKEVFQRSLDEITRHAVETVLDMIAEKNIYRGEEWQGPLEMFLGLHNEYHALPAEKRDVWCWAKSVEIGGAIAKIKNHSIGVLLQDIGAGVDLLEAVTRYERIMAPQNYKRPKPIFTRGMVEQAQETVERLGLIDSLPRRHARLSDITVNNVIWANRDAVREMEGLGVFDELAREVTVNPRQFERVRSVSAEEFVATVLPGAGLVEALLENRHEGNLVSLIAPVNPGATPLFRWGNGFSWAYAGNVTDSMKSRVKALGGDVSGALRFSIQWNENFDNRNDFDAHCHEPNGNHIYYPNKGTRHASTGMLDVDIIHPEPRQVAVENITWQDPGRMPTGVYDLFVHNYSHRGGRSGFRAEVEFAGHTLEFDYPHDINNNENVMVAKVRHNGAGRFEVMKSLPTSTTPREMWGLRSCQFHPVSVVTLSPNHWDGRGVGNRHYFFMLAGCNNPGSPNGFFNEYLPQDLLEHKRVFAALGAKMRVEPSENQLSGIGFSSTKRDSMIARIGGREVVKIIF
jgi:hypothetical protein